MGSNRTWIFVLKYNLVLFRIDLNIVDLKTFFFNLIFNLYISRFLSSGGRQLETKSGNQYLMYLLDLAVFSRLQ